jgi:hypothetical protein
MVSNCPALQFLDIHESLWKCDSHFLDCFAAFAMTESSGIIIARSTATWQSSNITHSRHCERSEAIHWFLSYAPTAIKLNAEFALLK